MSRHLMEHTIEHAKIKKVNVNSLQNIDMVRKCRGVMLPHESLGEKGRQLTNFGRVAE